MTGNAEGVNAVGSGGQQPQKAAASHYGVHEAAIWDKNGMDTIRNPIDVDGITFEEAGGVTEDVRSKLKEVAGTLPLRKSRLYLPSTLSEALSYVNAREDSKKKQGVSSLGGDVVSVSAQKTGPYPGVLEGAGEAAAFWLYTEDYFRNISADDVHEILSFLRPLGEDESFCLEHVGRKRGVDMMHGDAKGDADRTGFSTPRAREQVDGDGLVQDGYTGRRSRRPRSVKMDESGQPFSMGTASRSRLSGQDTMTPSSTAASLLGVDGGGEDGTPRPAQMSVSVTPEGHPATVPLDVLERSTVVELATTMQKLKHLVGKDVGDDSVDIESMDGPALREYLKDQVGEISEQFGFPASIDVSKVPPSVPNPRFVHPWTRMLLKSKVPQHVKEVVPEPYFLDPPGSLAQRCAGNVNVLDLAQDEIVNGVRSEPQFTEAGDQVDDGKATHIERVSVDVMRSINQGCPDTEFDNVSPRKLYKSAVKDLAVLRAAPQDEIAAETLALQAELISVMCANRARLAPALEAMLEDLPRQRERKIMQEEDYAFAKRYFDKINHAKVIETRYKKDMVTRSASGSHPLTNTSPNSNRPILGRDQSGMEGLRMPSLQEKELYDVLARRKEEDEAFCAVCGDGFSAEPNVILFCDRCDVAVHQKCYDIPDVPPHEWLCWPCKEYEEKLRASGKAQEEIRTPHALPEQRSQLPGGSKDVKCFLCPIKYGAFRRSSDGSTWVHQTCAMWHPETYLLHGMGPNVVEGLWDIPEERLSTPCVLCGLKDGAVVHCPEPGCLATFHVLCARNCGLYLTVQRDEEGGQHHRIYCSKHSKAQQENDSVALAKALAGKSNTQTRVNKRKMQEEQRRKELQDFSMLELDFAKMESMRVNFEALRVLLDQCKRREKLKRMHVQLQADAFKERLQDPEKAIQFVERINSLAGKGYTPDQIAADVWPTEHGQNKLEEKQQQPNKSRLGPSSIPSMTTKPSTGNSTLYTLDDTRTNTGRPSRRVPPTIEQQLVLKSSEAEELNKKLPPGIKYVPASQLKKK